MEFKPENFPLYQHITAGASEYKKSLTEAFEQAQKGGDGEKFDFANRLWADALDAKLFPGQTEEMSAKTRTACENLIADIATRGHKEAAWTTAFFKSRKARTVEEFKAAAQSIDHAEKLGMDVRLLTGYLPKKKKSFYRRTIDFFRF